MRLVRVASLILIGLALVPAAAFGAGDVNVTPGAPGAWTGPSAVGTNQAFDPQAFPANPAECGNTDATRCDITRLHINVAPSFWSTQGGGVDIAARNFTNPNSDFDLYVYTDAGAGTPGRLIAASAGPAGQNES